MNVYKKVKLMLWTLKSSDDEKQYIMEKEFVTRL